MSQAHQHRTHRASLLSTRFSVNPYPSTFFLSFLCSRVSLPPSSLSLSLTVVARRRRRALRLVASLADAEPSRRFRGRRAPHEAWRAPPLDPAREPGRKWDAAGSRPTAARAEAFWAHSATGGYAIPCATAQGGEGRRWCGRGGGPGMSS